MNESRWFERLLDVLAGVVLLAVVLGFIGEFEVQVRFSMEPATQEEAATDD